MKKFYLFCAAICFAAIPASAQNVEWARQLIAGGGQVSNAAHVDKDGNCYATGFFGGPMLVDDTQLNGSGFGDAFLLKFTPDGDLDWAVESTSDGWDGGRAVATDDDGNVYWTGRYDGNADIAGATLTAVGSNDVYTAKYDKDGNPLWVRSIGGGDLDWGNGIAVDAQGNVWVVGQFVGPAVAGGETLGGGGGNDAFLLKYNGDGDLLWALAGGGSAEDNGYDVVTDAAGNAYVCGNYNGAANMFGQALSSAGSSDCFFAKINADGSIGWMKTIGGSDQDVAESVALLDNGNIAVAGYFTGPTCDVAGAATLSGQGVADLFVATFAPDGTLVSAYSYGGPGDDGTANFGQSLALDAAADGGFILTSSFAGTADFGGESRTAIGDVDIFTGSFRADGSADWVFTCGGPEEEQFIGAGADQNGEVFIVGNFFSETLTCGEYSFAYTPPIMGTFVARLTTDFVPEPATIEVSTTLLDFGDVPQGTPKTMNIVVESVGDEVLEIYGLDHFDPDAESKGFKIVGGGAATLAKGESMTIQVEFTPAAAGEVESDISITCNDEQQAFILVDLRGTGTEASGGAVLGLDTPEMMFGGVAVGMSATLSGTITSGSQVTPLIISELNFGGNAAAQGFTLVSPTADELPITLSGGQTLTIAVEFAPAAPGAVTNELTIVSNAVNPTVSSIALSGEGVDETTSVDEEVRRQAGLTAELQFGGNVVNRRLNLMLDLERAATVRMTIVDLSGKVVKQLAVKQLPAGRAVEEVELSELPRGVYFLRVQGAGIPVTVPLMHSLD